MVNAEFASILLVVAIVGGIFLLAWLDLNICAWIDKRRDILHRKEHPEFFRLYDDFNEKANTGCRWHNAEIAPRKRKVKAMLEDEPYWPREVREQKMEELEKLRREIYTAELMDKTLNKETTEARQKVADYVHAHNIKWAGDWDT